MVNDDGPPSTTKCPYLLPLVKALQVAGHEVSVVIPDHSRSWLGKAHIISSTLTATSFHPEGTDSDGKENWTIVNGTPPTCVQLGLYHLHQNQDPIDLVISGPNHGRNATTIYNISSGTVGGAMEAALCGKKAIALSFASKDPQPLEIIASACRISIKLTNYLYDNWNDEVEVYAINVPMLPDVEDHKIVYTRSQPSRWTKTSLFQETIDPVNDSMADRAVRHFLWAPELSDIHLSVENAQPGTDAWAVREGFIRSVTSNALVRPRN